MSARMKPRCSVWMPRLPPLWAKLASGTASVASARTARDRRLPGRLQARRVGGDAGGGDRDVLVVGEEQLAGVGPEVVERGLHPAVALVGAVAEADRRGRRSVRGGRRPPWRPWRRSRRRAGRRRRPAPSAARGARRRTGTGASASGRSRRSGARRAARCGSPRRRAGRRGRRRCGPCPRPRRRGRARAAVWPIRSSAMLASAMSSSSAGAWPHHSETRWPRIRVLSPVRSRNSKKAAWPASGAGASTWRAWAAASRASSATFGVVMSGSDGITCAPLRRGCRRRSGGGRPWRWPARRAAPSRTGSRR